MRRFPLPIGMSVAVLSLAIAGTVTVAVPAHAQASHAADTVNATAHDKYQTLEVPDDVISPHFVADSYAAAGPNVPQLLREAAPSADASTLADTAAALGDLPGKRLTIVGTALGYLGVPYVFGGASRSGIDCSGLTMRAYEAAGISLSHSVIAQNSDGLRVTAADAKPGDLVVFDSGAHVAVYLGAGRLVAAPAPGRDVEVEPLSEWSGIAYHFTRLLDD